MTSIKTKVQTEPRVAKSTAMKRRTLFKAVTWFVCFVFFSEQALYAQDGAVLSRSASGDADLISSRQTTLDVRQFAIPRDLGVANEAVYFGSPETVIHLKDIHDSLSAQYSLSGLIDNLMTNYDIRTVMVEGSSGRVDVSLLSMFPDSGIRKKVSDDLMASGKLSAAEYFAALSDQKIAVYGADDAKLHARNMEVFREVLIRRDDNTKEIRKLEGVMERLIDAVFSKELKALEQVSILRQDSGLGFMERWKRIRAIGEKNGVALDSYPNVQSLFEASQVEGQIDFKRVNQERELLLNKLNRMLPRQRLEELILKSLSFKLGKISASMFYGYLADLAQLQGVDLSEYPNLSLYSRYMAFYESVNVSALRDETVDYEDRIRAKLFRSDAERELSGRLRMTEILRDLVSVKLTSGLLTYFREHRAAFADEPFGLWLERMHAEYGLAGEPEVNLKAIFDAVIPAEMFYELTEKRDAYLVNNTLKRMREEGQTSAVLVTGGFHTQGITELLNENRISHMVILPKFDVKGGKRPYLSIITRRQVSDEDAADADNMHIQIASFLDTARPIGEVMAEMQAVIDAFVQEVRVHFGASRQANPAQFDRGVQIMRQFLNRLKQDERLKDSELIPYVEKSLAKLTEETSVESEAESVSTTEAPVVEEAPVAEEVLTVETEAEAPADKEAPAGPKEMTSAERAASVEQCKALADEVSALEAEIYSLNQAMRAATQAKDSKKFADLQSQKQAKARELKSKQEALSALESQIHDAINALTATVDRDGSPEKFAVSLRGVLDVLAQMESSLMKNRGNNQSIKRLKRQVRGSLESLVTLIITRASQDSTPATEAVDLIMYLFDGRTLRGFNLKTQRRILASLKTSAEAKVRREINNTEALLIKLNETHAAAQAMAAEEAERLLREQVADSGLWDAVFESMSLEEWVELMRDLGWVSASSDAESVWVQIFGASARSSLIESMINAMTTEEFARFLIHQGWAENYHNEASLAQIIDSGRASGETNWARLGALFLIPGALRRGIDVDDVKVLQQSKPQAIAAFLGNKRLFEILASRNRRDISPIEGEMAIRKLLEKQNFIGSLLRSEAFRSWLKNPARQTARAGVLLKLINDLDANRVTAANASVELETLFAQLNAIVKKTESMLEASAVELTAPVKDAHTLFMEEITAQVEVEWTDKAESKTWMDRMLKTRRGRYLIVRIKKWAKGKSMLTGPAKYIKAKLDSRQENHQAALKRQRETRFEELANEELNRSLIGRDQKLLERVLNLIQSDLGRTRLARWYLALDAQDRGTLLKNLAGMQNPGNPFNALAADFAKNLQEGDLALRIASLRFETMVEEAELKAEKTYGNRAPPAGKTRSEVIRDQTRQILFKQIRSQIDLEKKQKTRSSNVMDSVWGLMTAAKDRWPGLFYEVFDQKEKLGFLEQSRDFIQSLNEGSAVRQKTADAHRQNLERYLREQSPSIDIDSSALGFELTDLEIERYSLLEDAQGVVEALQNFKQDQKDHQKLLAVQEAKAGYANRQAASPELTEGQRRSKARLAQYKRDAAESAENLSLWNQIVNPPAPASVRRAEAEAQLKTLEGLIKDFQSRMKKLDRAIESRRLFLQSLLQRYRKEGLRLRSHAVPPDEEAENQIQTRTDPDAIDKMEAQRVEEANLVSALGLKANIDELKAEVKSLENEKKRLEAEAENQININDKKEKLARRIGEVEAKLAEKTTELNNYTALFEGKRGGWKALDEVLGLEYVGALNLLVLDYYQALQDLDHKKAEELRKQIGRVMMRRESLDEVQNPGVMIQRYRQWIEQTRKKIKKLEAQQKRLSRGFGRKSALELKRVQDQHDELVKQNEQFIKLKKKLEDSLLTLSLENQTPQSFVDWAVQAGFITQKESDNVDLLIGAFQSAERVPLEGYQSMLKNMSDKDKQRAQTFIKNKARAKNEIDIALQRRLFESAGRGSIADILEFIRIEKQNEAQAQNKHGQISREWAQAFLELSFHYGVLTETLLKSESNILKMNAYRVLIEKELESLGSGMTSSLFNKAVSEALEDAKAESENTLSDFDSTLWDHVVFELAVKHKEQHKEKSVLDLKEITLLKGENKQSLYVGQQFMLNEMLRSHSVALATGAGKTYTFALYHELLRLTMGDQYRGLMLVENRDAIRNYIAGADQTENKNKQEQAVIQWLQKTSGLTIVDGGALFDKRGEEKNKLIKTLQSPDHVLMIDYISWVHVGNDAVKTAQSGDKSLLEAIDQVNQINLDEYHRFLASRESGLISEGDEKTDPHRVSFVYDLMKGLADFRDGKWHLKVGADAASLEYKSDREFQAIVSRYGGQESVESSQSVIIVNEKTGEVYLTAALLRRLSAESLGHSQYGTERIRSVIRALVAVEDHHFAGGFNEEGRYVVFPVNAESGVSRNSSFQDTDYQIALALRLSSEGSRLDYESENAAGMLGAIEQEWKDHALEMVRISRTSMQSAIAQSIRRSSRANVVGGTATLQGFEGPSDYLIGSGYINISGSALNAKRISSQSVQADNDTAFVADTVNNLFAENAAQLVFVSSKHIEDIKNLKEALLMDFLLKLENQPNLTEEEKQFIRDSIGKKGGFKIDFLGSGTTEEELKEIVDEPWRFQVAKRWDKAGNPVEFHKFATPVPRIIMITERGATGRDYKPLKDFVFNGQFKALQSLHLSVYKAHELSSSNFAQLLGRVGRRGSESSARRRYHVNAKELDQSLSDLKEPVILADFRMKLLSRRAEDPEQTQIILGYLNRYVNEVELDLNEKLILNAYFLEVKDFVSGGATYSISDNITNEIAQGFVRHDVSVTGAGSHFNQQMRDEQAELFERRGEFADLELRLRGMGTGLDYVSSNMLLAVRQARESYEHVVGFKDFDEKSWQIFRWKNIKRWGVPMLNPMNWREFIYLRKRFRALKQKEKRLQSPEGIAGRYWELKARRFRETAAEGTPRSKYSLKDVRGESDISKIIDLTLDASLALAERDVFVSRSHSGGYKGQAQTTVHIQTPGVRNESLFERVRDRLSPLETQIEGSGDGISVLLSRLPYHQLPPGTPLMLIRNGRRLIMRPVTDIDQERDNFIAEFDMTDDLEAMLSRFGTFGVFIGEVSPDGKKGRIQFRGFTSDTHGKTSVKQIMTALGFQGNDETVSELMSLALGFETGESVRVGAHDRIEDISAKLTAKEGRMVSDAEVIRRIGTNLAIPFSMADAHHVEALSLTEDEEAILDRFKGKEHYFSRKANRYQGFDATDLVTAVRRLGVYGDDDRRYRQYLAWLQAMSGSPFGGTEEFIRSELSRRGIEDPQILEKLPTGHAVFSNRLIHAILAMAGQGLIRDEIASALLVYFYESRNPGKDLDKLRQTLDDTIRFAESNTKSKALSRKEKSIRVRAHQPNSKIADRAAWERIKIRLKSGAIQNGSYAMTAFGRLMDGRHRKRFKFGLAKAGVFEWDQRVDGYRPGLSASLFERFVYPLTRIDHDNRWLWWMRAGMILRWPFALLSQHKMNAIVKKSMRSLMHDQEVYGDSFGTLRWLVPPGELTLHLMIIESKAQSIRDWEEALQTKFFKKFLPELIEKAADIDPSLGSLRAVATILFAAAELKKRLRSVLPNARQDTADFVDSQLSLDALYRLGYAASETANVRDGSWTYDRMVSKLISEDLISKFGMNRGFLMLMIMMDPGALTAQQVEAFKARMSSFDRDEYERSNENPIVLLDRLAARIQSRVAGWQALRGGVGAPQLMELSGLALGAWRLLPDGMPVGAASSAESVVKEVLKIGNLNSSSPNFVPEFEKWIDRYVFTYPDGVSKSAVMLALATGNQQGPLSLSQRKQILVLARKSVPPTRELTESVNRAFSNLLAEEAMHFDGHERVLRLKEALENLPSREAALRRELAAALVREAEAQALQSSLAGSDAAAVHVHALLDFAHRVAESHQLATSVSPAQRRDAELKANHAESELLRRMDILENNRDVIGAMRLVSGILIGLPEPEFYRPALVEEFGRLHLAHHSPSLEAVFEDAGDDNQEKRRERNLRLNRSYYRLHQSVFADSQIDRNRQDPEKRREQLKAMIEATAEERDMFFVEEGVRVAERELLFPDRIAVAPRTQPAFGMNRTADPRWFAAQQKVRAYYEQRIASLESEVGASAVQARIPQANRDKVIQAMAARLYEGSFHPDPDKGFLKVQEKISTDLDDMKNLIKGDRTVHMAGSDEAKLANEVHEAMIKELKVLAPDIEARIKNVQVMFVDINMTRNTKNLRTAKAAFLEGAGVLVIPVHWVGGKWQADDIGKALIIHETLHAVSLDFGHHDMREGLVSYFASRIANTLGDAPGAQKQQRVYPRAYRQITRWIEEAADPNHMKSLLLNSLLEGSFDRSGLYGIKEAVQRLVQAGVREVLINGSQVSVDVLREKFEYLMSEDEDNYLNVNPIYVRVERDEKGQWVILPSPSEVQHDLRVSALVPGMNDGLRVQARNFISRVLPHVINAYYQGKITAADEARILNLSYKIHPEMGYFTGTLLELMKRKGDGNDQGKATGQIVSQNQMLLKPLNLEVNAEFNPDSGMLFLNGFDVDHELPGTVLGVPVPTTILVDLDTLENQSRNSAVNRGSENHVSQFRNKILSWISKSFFPISSGEYAGLYGALTSDLDEIRDGKNGKIFSMNDFGKIQVNDVPRMSKQYPHILDFVDKINQEAWRKPLVSGTQKYKQPGYLGHNQTLRQDVVKRIIKTTNKLAEKNVTEQRILNKGANSTPDKSVVDLLRGSTEPVLKVHELRHKRDEREQINGVSRSSLLVDMVETELTAHLESGAADEVKEALSFMLYQIYGYVDLGTAGREYKKVGARILSRLAYGNGAWGLARAKVAEWQMLGDTDHANKVLKNVFERISRMSVEKIQANLKDQLKAFDEEIESRRGSRDQEELRLQEKLSMPEPRSKGAAGGGPPPGDAVLTPALGARIGASGVVAAPPPDKDKDRLTQAHGARIAGKVVENALETRVILVVSEPTPQAEKLRRLIEAGAKVGGVQALVVGYSGAGALDDDQIKSLVGRDPVQDFDGSYVVEDLRDQNLETESGMGELAASIQKDVGTHAARILELEFRRIRDHILNVYGTPADSEELMMAFNRNLFEAIVKLLDESISLNLQGWNPELAAVPATLSGRTRWVPPASARQTLKLLADHSKADIRDRALPGESDWARFERWVQYLNSGQTGGLVSGLFAALKSRTPAQADTFLNRDSQIAEARRMLMGLLKEIQDSAGVPAQIVIDARTGTGIDFESIQNGFADIIRGLKRTGLRLPEIFVVSDGEERTLDWATVLHASPGDSVYALALPGNREFHNRVILSSDKGIPVLSAQLETSPNAHQIGNSVFVPAASGAGLLSDPLESSKILTLAVTAERIRGASADLPVVAIVGESPFAHLLNGKRIRLFKLLGDLLTEVGHLIRIQRSSILQAA